MAKVPTKPKDGTVLKVPSRVRLKVPFFGPDGEMYPVVRSGCVIPAGIMLPRTAKVLGEASFDAAAPAPADNGAAQEQLIDMSKQMAEMQEKLDKLEDEKAAAETSDDDKDDAGDAETETETGLKL